MKAIEDPGHALDAGLAAIRAQFDVPASFPPAVLAAADAAARRTPTEHVDRTDVAFVTLDPATSTDLDQALAIEPAGADLLLRYAIADVAWFVDDGDPCDVEAWKRGETQYLPDGRAGLYPPALAEAAASLLPDGPRPAVVFAVRVAPDGSATLDGAERAIVLSRAKLAYTTVTEAELPAGFVELARRVQSAEDRRGASRVEPPEQGVERIDGGYALVFRDRLASEDRNAALSLATNLAVADALLHAGTGLFRTMPAPDGRAVGRLRHTAEAFGVAWQPDEPLDDLERRLDGHEPRQAAMMLAIRRASGGARYVPFEPGVVPWHSAMAATYAHATAPLRRLADRYVVRAALAIARGEAVPAAVTDAFARLPDVMQRADAKAGQLERAVIDLAESVVLGGSVGRTFDAVVTDVDERGARVQLREHAVVGRVAAHGVQPGNAVRVKLVGVDPAQRRIDLERVG
ncbi:MAG: RNB domain-containing ribonuclease [Ilumatobacteraceae bacterium]